MSYKTRDGREVVVEDIDAGGDLPVRGTIAGLDGEQRWSKSGWHPRGVEMDIVSLHPTRFSRDKRYRTKSGLRVWLTEIHQPPRMSPLEGTIEGVEGTRSWGHDGTSSYAHHMKEWDLVEVPTLKLGTKYMTRSGHIASVDAFVERTQLFPARGKFGECDMAWSDDGRVNERQEHPLDLVSEYKEIDMDEPLFVAGGKYKTRSGLDVNLFRTDMDIDGLSISGAVAYEGKLPTVMQMFWRKDGTHPHSQSYDIVADFGGIISAPGEYLTRSGAHAHLDCSRSIHQYGGTIEGVEDPTMVDRKTKHAWSRRGINLRDPAWDLFPLPVKAVKEEVAPPENVTTVPCQDGWKTRCDRKVTITTAYGEIVGGGCEGTIEGIDGTHSWDHGGRHSANCSFDLFPVFNEDQAVDTKFAVGYYRTRCGVKATVTIANELGEYPLRGTIADMGSAAWMADGHLDKDVDDPYDLILADVTASFAPQEVDIQVGNLTIKSKSGHSFDTEIFRDGVKDLTIQELDLHVAVGEKIMVKTTSWVGVTPEDKQEPAGSQKIPPGYVPYFSGVQAKYKPNQKIAFSNKVIPVISTEEELVSHHGLCWIPQALHDKVMEQRKEQELQMAASVIQPVEYGPLDASDFDSRTIIRYADWKVSVWDYAVPNRNDGVRLLREGYDVTFHELKHGAWLWKRGGVGEWEVCKKPAVKE